MFFLLLAAGACCSGLSRLNVSRVETLGGVAIVLRSVTRVAGVDALAKHWPGTPEGLAASYRLGRLRQTS
jgi:hypothetical protein